MSDRWCYSHHRHRDDGYSHHRFGRDQCSVKAGYTFSLLGLQSLENSDVSTFVLRCDSVTLQSRKAKKSGIQLMPMSTDIRLPKSVSPVFPNRCVFSGEANPDSKIFVIAHSQSAILSFLAPILMLFGWRRVSAPVLKKYRAPFYLQTFGRDFIMIALVFVALFVFIPMFGRQTSFRKFKLLGLVLAVVSPWIMFEVFWPRRFEVTSRGEWVDYEFASAAYALEFELLNAEHVIQVE